MNKYLPFIVIALTSLGGFAQEASLPASLTSAVKEGLQKLEDKKQEDIIYYSKNNTPKQADIAAANGRQGDFYELYTKNPDNLYYSTYYNNNNDPVLTNMPAPGPNLNYWSIDPCSSGNYDKIVKQ